jgi:hypothetical protein
VIKKGDLVVFDCPNSVDSRLTGLVCRDPYISVFTSLNKRTQKTLSSSEKLVVDILSDGTIYKKVLVDNIEKTG